MIVVLDGGCKFCRKMGELVGGLNIFGWLDIRYNTDACGADVLKDRGIGVDIDNIVGIKGNGKIVVGVYCWREIFLRLPICWFMVWVMYVPFSMMVWGKLYEYVRDNRYSIIKCKHNCRIN